MSKALNKDDFINAALEVVNDVGVDKLSMRKVAAVMNVSSMAVYKHFSNKEALLSAALDEFIARSETNPDMSLPWDIWLTEMAEGMYKALAEEDSWVPLLGALKLGDRASFVTENFIKKMSESGFIVEQALIAYFSMIQLVIGAVCLNASLKKQTVKEGKHSGDVSPVTKSYLKKLSAERLEVAPMLDKVSKIDPLKISLPLLIAGLKSQLRA